MKYQFNKTCPLLINKERECRKISFQQQFESVRSYNVSHKFLLEVSALLDDRHCPKLQSCAILRETIDANLR